MQAHFRCIIQYYSTFSTVSEKVSIIKSALCAVAVLTKSIHITLCNMAQGWRPHAARYLYNPLHIHPADHSRLLTSRTFCPSRQTTSREERFLWEHFIFHCSISPSETFCYYTESGVEWGWVSICSLHELPLLKAWTPEQMEFCFLHLSFSDFWGKNRCRKQTDSFMVSIFLLLTGIVPELQSLRNAKLYLACTAAYLAPVPSAICPDRCTTSHIPLLLCILLSSCPNLGGSEVEASVKLSQTNEDAQWSVVCVCATVRWDCTITLPWV